MIIKRAILTEKSHNAKALKEYYFEVDRRANKIEIKKAIESLFGVKVDDVRTSILKGENRVFKGKQIVTPTIKKAIVRLKEGEL